MTEAVIAAVAALSGVLVGYFLRWGEFRREKRYEVYTSYLIALVNVGRTADALVSRGMSSDKLRTALERFDEERINLQLVITSRIAKTTNEAHEFVEGDVAPLVKGQRPRDREGIDSFEREAIKLARAIAAKGQRDVSGFGLPLP